ncbi:MAG: transaldolase [Anaerolineae bacterium]|nr:transaldolase [Anaerolineae bacterium]
MISDNAKLRLYLDSADISLWEKYLPSGIFFGITVNPKILRMAEVECSLDALTHLAKTAFKLGAKELHLQVWGESTDAWLQIGRQLASIDKRVMVKVPITEKGIFCAKELIEEGAGITFTAAYADYQILAAISLKAHYIAPYLGRMMDAGQDGIKEIITMQEIIDAAESPLRLLVASIRQIDDVVTLAKHGVSCFTLSPNMVNELLKNDLSQKATDAFEIDAQWSKK